VAEDKDPVVLAYVGNRDGLGYHQAGIATADLHESQVQEVAADRFEGDYEAAFDWLASTLCWEPTKKAARAAKAATADDEDDTAGEDAPATTVAGRAAQRRGR
jgi:hypothetical protein